MKTSTLSIVACLLAVAIIGGPPSVIPAGAEDTLRYSASAQIYEAFGQLRLNAFTQETGIEVDLFVCSSGSALHRLLSGVSDLASSTRGLYYRYKESGYMEIPFCKDPLAVIVNAENPVKGLTDLDVRRVFSKEVTNWREIGGPDAPIVVVVPGKGTAAYKNFDRLAMDRKEIQYDFMSNLSTQVIPAVEQFPLAISFISHGSAIEHPNVRAISVDGRSIKDADYPYFQTFYYFTQGAPSGAAKAFIDFTRSEKGVDLMKQKGMIPINTP